MKKVTVLMFMMALTITQIDQMIESAYVKKRLFRKKINKQTRVISKLERLKEYRAKFPTVSDDKFKKHEDDISRAIITEVE